MKMHEFYHIQWWHLFFTHWEISTNIKLIKSVIQSFKQVDWFVEFYGTSVRIGYLMPNSLYTYVKYIWFVAVNEFYF